MKPNKLAILYPILFFFATSMFIRTWVPALHSSWPSLFAACLVSIYVAPQFLRTRWFVVIMVYSMMMIINWMSGDKVFDSSMDVANEFANLFLFSSFCYYCYKSNDKRCIKVTLYIMLTLVGIAAIGSFIVNQINPAIVREQAMFVESGNEDVLLGYYRMGLSNYLLPHGVPAIIPPLILIIKRTKEKKWFRFVAALFLAFTLLLIYLGGSTTVLLLSFLALSTFLIKDTGANSRYLTLVIIMTLLFLPIMIIPELLTGLIGVFSSETAEIYATHIQDMADFSSAGAAGNTSLRMQLYLHNINEFISSPIWGTNNLMTDHSVLLDRLGALGLLGFIPFIAIIVSFVKFVSRYLDKSERGYFNVTVLVVIMMLLLKGIENKEIWLMFFAVSPLLFYVSHRLKYN